MKNLIFIFLLFSSFYSCFAQSLENQFAAIVQHSEGQFRQNSEPVELQFKQTLKFNTEITSSPNSRLKLITEKRCIAVIYENSTILTPKDKTSPWILKDGSVRWICPERTLESIEVNNKKLKIQNGEILFTQNKLLTFRDHVFYDSKKLKSNSVYLSESNDFKLTNLSENQIWEIDSSYPKPQESSRLKAYKPLSETPSRIFLQYQQGFGGVHDWSSEVDLTSNKYETFGLRIGTNFLINKKFSTLIFLDYLEFENPDATKNYSGPTPIGYKSNRLMSFMLAAGFRHQHNSSGSLYAYSGIGRMESETYFRGNGFDQNSRIIYKSNLTLGGGYQYHFFSKSRVGLLIGIEGRINQTLHKGSIKENRIFGFPQPEPRGRLLNYSINLNLGPVFQF